MTSPVTPTFVPAELIVSSSLRHLLETVVNIFLCLLTSSFGLVTNPIIIVVFHKMGARDSASLSLIYIAAWDILICGTAWVHRVYGILSLVDPALGYSWDQAMTPTVVYVNVLSTVVSGVLGAYVALERFVCVWAPFAAKGTLTSRLALTLMVSLSTFVFGSLSIIFGAYDVRLAWSLVFNETVAEFSPSAFYARNADIVYAYFNYTLIAWPAASFITMLLCTALTVHRLRQSQDFRSRAVMSGAHLTRKDVKTTRMLTVVVVIYLSAIFPKLSFYALRLFAPGVYIFGLYHNLAMAMSYFLHWINLVSASVNVFVYWNMSATFRRTFISMSARMRLRQNVTMADRQSVKRHNSRITQTKM